LGDGFCGSKRHLKKQAINGLHIVSHFGPSHIFATLTCNKNWPEFKEVLWPESDVFGMPALVAEVFHARLQAFLHNLRHGKYFGGDTTVFIIRVIEYQERGLPHAHIVYRLQAASRKFKKTSAAWKMLTNNFLRQKSLLFRDQRMTTLPLYGLMTTSLPSYPLTLAFLSIVRDTVICMIVQSSFRRI
jgi:hypothetical protein